MDAATKAKSAVEDAQREDRRRRDESGAKHVPRFFELVDDQWTPKLRLPADAQEAQRAVHDFIWPTSASASASA
jgi:oxysterol-binding protein-related protein 8